QTGVAMGTPYYMAPEQGMGRAVDRRADIYSLGVILYQIFAGTLPFEGATAHEIVFKHVSETPAPPSRHRPIVPKEMEAIILAGLGKDPGRRPARVGELAFRMDAAFAEAAGAPAKPAIIPTVPRLTRPTPVAPGGQSPTGPQPLPEWVDDLPPVRSAR